jgi:ABC-2 type transport system permease protein
MIPTLLRIHFTNLRRDRTAQILTFAVPIAFFTIFAFVFGSRGRDATPRVPVVVVDESRTPVSKRLVRALAAEKSLRVRTTARASAADTTRVPIDRARAEAMVRGGDVSVALVVPAGIDTSIGRFDGGGVPFTLLSDPSDPIAPQMVGGLLQKTVMTSAPSALARQGVGQFDRYAGGLTPKQREASTGWFRMLELRESDTTLAGLGPAADSSGSSMGMVRIETKELLGRKRDTSMISFYAAGIAVMFLLFSASGAAGSLLDEVESGTLERVLTSRVGMTGLLAGKWIYLVLLGCLGITVMFVYAMLLFHLDLLAHLPGFAVMTVVTAGVAGAFGLMLATLSRTRQQMGGISTLLIISLSALGGSMFPRFLMSEGMQRLGLLTFNAWALDGYVKVFWRDARLVDLAPQVGVLLAFMAAFLIAARLLARRWERA